MNEIGMSWELSRMAIFIWAFLIKQILRWIKNDTA